jgi:hypothetical protein
MMARLYWATTRTAKSFGLTIFLGTKSTVWRFRQQSRSKGKRSSVFKTLGNWPAMDVDEAGKQALIYSGTVAAGTAAPGRRQAMPFRKAFENYLAHLMAQAEATIADDHSGFVPSFMFVMTLRRIGDGWRSLLNGGLAIAAQHPIPFGAYSRS